MANQNSNQGGQGRDDGKSSGGGRGNPRGGERGFAAMDPKQQREIASEGGRAAHEKGTAHEFTSEEARAAGRKGGEATAQQRARNNALRSSTANRSQADKKDEKSPASGSGSDVESGRKRDH